MKKLQQIPIYGKRCDLMTELVKGMLTQNTSGLSEDRHLKRKRVWHNSDMTKS